MNLEDELFQNKLLSNVGKLLILFVFFKDYIWIIIFTKYDIYLKVNAPEGFAKMLETYIHGGQKQASVEPMQFKALGEIFIALKD